MKKRCPVKDCSELVTPSTTFYCYDCPVHRQVSVVDVEDFDQSERVVWVREPRKVYTKTLPSKELWPKGRISTPGLEAFVWEPWP